MPIEVTNGTSRDLAIAIPRIGRLLYHSFCKSTNPPVFLCRYESERRTNGVGSNYFYNIKLERSILFCAPLPLTQALKWMRMDDNFLREDFVVILIVIFEKQVGEMAEWSKAPD